MLCQLCEKPIDCAAIYAKYQKLIDAVDSGACQELTDLEETIYLMRYCLRCIESESS